MNLVISPELLAEIHAHGAAAYPEEGAGLLLGIVRGETKRVARLITFPNAREEAARHNRYLLTPQDYLHGEQEADRLGLEVLGVFHSHPDHPNQPSEYDREWAMPWLSYVITSVERGKAVESRSWVLESDRSGFREEPLASASLPEPAPSQNSLEKVDHAALSVNQAAIILLNLLAFLLDLPWLAGLVALAMLLGTLFKRPAFGILYQRFLRPLGWVKPNLLFDHPEPHRFAQGLGGAFMLAGGLALWADFPTLGWGLVWLVNALAALNLLVGFCLGCFVYYWLSRLKIPGFLKSPPNGVFPGMRPPASSKREVINAP